MCDRNEVQRILAKTRAQRERLNKRLQGVGRFAVRLVQARAD